jgi:prophage maintenance system killer protein
MQESRLELYKSDDGNIQMEVRLQEETVWATQRQMAELFSTTAQNITIHLKRIYQEDELEEKSTCKEYLQVQKEGNRTVKRKQLFYNLDAILSVGYRINSKRGTQFRIWATQRLKDYLVQGYAINEKRLAQKEMQVQHLKTGIQILSRAIEDKAGEQGNEWLLQFAKGLALLDDYDHENLDAHGLSSEPAVYPAKNQYQELINQMKADFASGVFGLEKDQGFDSAIHQIAQSFGGQELYPTLEEKAAMLLYLITKNHAFADGNKRIAAACFLLFLEQNKLLNVSKTKPIISNEALASLTLFVAASKPDEMETVKKLIISVLNRNQ